MSVTIFLDDDEVTAEAYQVDVTRGRSLETDVFNPGGGTVRVRNYEANFNPYFLTTTFRLLQENDDALLLESGDDILLENGNGSGTGTYGDIELGRKVTVKDGAVTVFTGFVEDFDYTYDTDHRSEATMAVRDRLATLGATSLREWVTTEGQLTGARITSLLDRTEVGFPSGVSARDISTGTQPLGSGTVRFGTNALQELQRINRAESGRTFVDRSGVLAFQDRYGVFGVTPLASFSDDGTALPFSDLAVRFGTELLHFSVSVTRDGSDVEQTSTNDALVAGYPNLGVRHLPIGPVPFQSDDHSLGLTQFLLERFASFSAVISGLTIPLGRLTSVNRATVCALDIGDVIDVSWTPYGATGPVTQVLVIEAAAYSARRSKNATGTSAEAIVTFQLSDASDPDYFQVDTDAVDGPALLAP